MIQHDDEKFLKEQERRLEEIERDIKESFEQAGIRVETLQEFLHDESRFSHDAWRLMQLYRISLRQKYESLLEERVEKRKELEAAKKTTTQPQQHWIFVR